jgi:hypothetical protein
VKKHLYLMSAFLLAGLPLIGCSAKVSGSLSSGGTGSVSVTSGEPEEATVAKFALTDDPASKTKKDSFTPNTAKIYAEMEVAGIKEGDRVKTALVCDSAINPADKKEIKNQTVLSDTKTLQAGMKGVEEIFSAPTKGWPVGDYHIDVYINDKIAQTAKLTVEDAKS